MRKQIYNLTTLRAFAAFSVFLHHCLPLGLNFSKHLWNVNLGWTVSFFFVLSGFVLSYSYDGKIKSAADVSRLILLRFLRLWPLHLACAAIAIIAFGIRGLNFEDTYLFLTLQHAWVPSYRTAFAINGVTWSISDEMFFYILFPFFIMFRGRALGLLLLGWLAAIIALITFTQFYPLAMPFSPEPARGLGDGVSARSFFHLFPPVRFVEFLAGMVVYQVRKAVRLPDTRVVYFQAGCILAIVGYIMIHATVAGFFFERGRLFGLGYISFGIFPFFALIIYIFSHEKGVISDFMARPSLVYLGNVSFAFYMVHQLVIRFFAEHGLHTRFGSVEGFFLALSTSVGASIILHKLVERPVSSWVKSGKLTPLTNFGSIREAPIGAIGNGEALVAPSV